MTCLVLKICHTLCIIVHSNVIDLCAKCLCPQHFETEFSCTKMSQNHDYG